MMQISRITIPLDPPEAAALTRSARMDYRNPHLQAKYLLREALNQRGLLPEGISENRTNESEGASHEQCSSRA